MFGVGGVEGWLEEFLIAGHGMAVVEKVSGGDVKSKLLVSVVVDCRRVAFRVDAPYILEVCVVSTHGVA